MTAIATLPLPLLFRGKVRDVYAVADEHLLLVASDRVSAFDVVMNEPVPDKGRVLTQITAWWLHAHLADIPNHLVSVRPGEMRRLVPQLADCPGAWEGRATLVRRTRPLPVECVVRGYLSGSAWKEYRQAGTLAGEPLEPRLVESDALVPAIFSPATKAQEGHDENITFRHVTDLLGAELANRLRERSLDIYERGRAAAAEAGIILADTKFEFGISPEGELLLIDEVLTPDSSRFWPREHYATGRGQPSLDKQPVRDYLETLGGWNKQYPPPALPPEVVAATSERYRDVFRRLTGEELDRYEPPRFGSGTPPGEHAPAAHGTEAPQ
ncbi:MAG: phosphoribosylaminoimidazolesuccinocarboxamide synthase [Gemmatimonadetes bacterium]|nr:phosphoribosylaminoimidazolesuccinocarboxamide synthase [Gemmatimonadota bacterium]